MKAPQAQAFPTVENSKDLAPQARKNKATASETVRRSYTLNQANDDKINAVAMQMTQKRGKPVSASEALRSIIDAYKVKP